MTRADPGETDILAYLRHQDLERRRTYVAEGRRFATLAPDDLETAWAEAFVAMCLHGDASRVRDIDDLTAEIGLRGRALPAPLVRQAMPDIQARARHGLTPQVLARFSGRVDAFRRRAAAANGPS